MLVPATALAQPLQINLNGAQRAVPSTAGTNCDVLPYRGAPTALTCPDGSRGTITLYGQNEDTAVCEVDFWFQSNRWHAILSHQNSAGGTCAMQWTDSATLQLSVH